jgi:beta-galactosidase
MIHLFPHWNWKGKEGKVIQVMAYTNCDTVELFVNGKSFGAKSVQFPRPGNSGAWNRYDVPPVSITTGDLHLIWDVPYAAGTLKAVGRKGNKVVVEEEIKTTGMPAAIRLSVDKNTINAEPGDVAHLKVEVVDANGLAVPDANNPIRLTVEGAGNLIGFDNGNPRDSASMKSSQRKLFNGLALAVIQSNNKPGTVRVQAASPGIKEASLEITTQKLNSPVATIESLKK